MISENSVYPPVLVPRQVVYVQCGCVLSQFLLSTPEYPSGM